MFNFASILTDLQAAIAVVSARHRALTPLLVAVWGRIARMRTRLERLVALWRAGKLPRPRPARDRRVVAPCARAARIRQSYPSARGWLAIRVWQATAFRGQLEHLLSNEECAAFLAAVPQAGRILRPLFHMLGVDPPPDVIARKPRPMPAAPVAEVAPVGEVPDPVVQFSAA